jgi:enamine deaminase RidA (YjgF/YER057c/UK114 family)
MSITRYGITDRTNGLPIISRAVVHGDMVYLCGVTPDPAGEITSQTKQVPDRIDHLLHQAGTDKSKLLTAQVWLSDMRLFKAYNAAWNAWVDPKNPPVRACVQTDLWRPGMLVEIMVTAAREGDTA